MPRPSGSDHYKHAVRLNENLLRVLVSFAGLRHCLMYRVVGDCKTFFTPGLHPKKYK